MTPESSNTVFIQVHWQTEESSWRRSGADASSRSRVWALGHRALAGGYPLGLSYYHYDLLFSSSSSSSYFFMVISKPFAASSVLLE